MHEWFCLQAPTGCACTSETRGDHKRVTDLLKLELGRLLTESLQRPFGRWAVFGDRVFLCIPGCLGTQDVSYSEIYLPLLPKCWGQRCVPLCLAIFLKKHRKGVISRGKCIPLRGSYLLSWSSWLSLALLTDRSLLSRGTWKLTENCQT